jgi:hypothetical protein
MFTGSFRLETSSKYVRFDLDFLLWDTLYSKILKQVAIFNPKQFRKDETVFAYVTQRVLIRKHDEARSIFVLIRKHDEARRIFVLIRKHDEARSVFVLRRAHEGCMSPLTSNI